MMIGIDKKYLVLLALFVSVLVWSAINPHDYFTWLLEVFPALIALMVIAYTFKRFPLTDLAYTLILVHSCILFVGGHYTYAEVPFFSWLRDVLDQDRNNYDKVGHFAQGFIPAIIVREILIRNNAVVRNGFLPFIVVCICLSISALYELLEWFVAVATGESSEAFLGTQGYVWDTQSDMLYAFSGSICALIILTSYHNRQLQALRD